MFFARRERETFRRGATERTLALLTAVDAELSSSIATLEALAASHDLDRNGLRAFHDEAARALRSQPDWLTINLAPPSGAQVVNVLRPFGTELPMTAERPSFDRVLQSRQPAVGNLVSRPFTKEHGFAVRVPVLRDGVVTYVLSAVVTPAAMSRLLAAQRLPPDWIGVVLDGNARFVARTVDTERAIGELASDSLRTALGHSPEGWFRGSTIEGWTVYTPYNRSAFSGWAVAMGIPATVVEAAGRQAMATIAGGMLAASVVALLLALALGRRITVPISALAAAAKAIGRGSALRCPRMFGWRRSPLSAAPSTLPPPRCGRGPGRKASWPPSSSRRTTRSSATRSRASSRRGTRRRRGSSATPRTRRAAGTSRS